MKKQIYKNFNTWICAITLLISTTSLISCESYEKQFFASESSLEWARDAASEELPVWVDLEETSTGNHSLYFQIKQTGIPSSTDETVQFVIDTVRSTAVLGKHILIPGGTSTVIPANSQLSDSITIQVLSDAIERDRDLRLVLSISNTGGTSPNMNSKRRELILYISKEQSNFPIYTLNLQNPGSNSGLTMVNLDTLGIYTRTQANQNEAMQRGTDFGFWNSSSRAYVFMVPTSYRLSGWGSGQTIQEEWSYKNDGIFMKLPAGAENDQLFTGTQTRQDFTEAFRVARERTKRLDTYDYGPHGHVHFLETGDIVFFHSLSRNIRAIMRVESATTGGSGTMELSVKRLIDYN